MQDGKDGKNTVEAKESPKEGPFEAQPPAGRAAAASAVYLYSGIAADQSLTTNELRVRGPVR